VFAQAQGGASGEHVVDLVLVVRALRIGLASLQGVDAHVQ
jgi:hypothetical protein